MLVVSRRVGESIIMKVPPSSTETFVKIMVVGKRLNIARIGVEAPIEVTIHREEVQRRIDDELEARPQRPDAGRDQDCVSGDSGDLEC